MRALPATLRFPGALLLAALALGFVACGDDDSPTAPAPMASLAARGDLDFNCGVNCSYEGEAANRGDGCAANVRGITRLLGPDGSELASDEWEMEAGRRVNRPRSSSTRAAASTRWT